MGLPFDFTGITQGISRAISGLLDIGFTMPGTQGLNVPLWLIAGIVVAVLLGFQLRRGR